MASLEILVEIKFDGLGKNEAKSYWRLKGWSGLLLEVVYNLSYKKLHPTMKTAFKMK